MKILTSLQNTWGYKLITDNTHYGIWALAVASIFGSLYFSEIKEMPPCNLCWWLRLLLYPIAFIMTVAIIRKSYHNIFYEVLAFSIPATVLSLYHSLLQWGIIKEAQVLCSSTASVPCDKPNFMFLGFITIPFLGLVTSVSISALSLMAIRNNKNQENGSLN